MKFLLISESVLLLPCAGEVGVDGDALLELADNVCGLADIDARKSAVRVEHESECAALIVDLGADRLKRSEGILRQRESVEAGAVVLGNICKSLAALGNESDADLPAAALLDAGSRLDACGIDFIGSALCRGQEACKSCAVGSFAAVEGLVVGLRIVVGKQGLCDARDSRTAGDAVDLRGSALDSLDRDLAGVAFIAEAYLLKNATISALLPLTGAFISAAGLLPCWPP